MTIRYDECNKIGDALAEAIEATANDAKIKKAVTSFVNEIGDEIEYRVVGQMAEALQDFVGRMVDRTIEAMLQGNETEVRRYLNLDGWTGREYAEKPGSVIHGQLHEPHTITLRRRLCEAHPELLRNERIADLEAQVTGLLAEVNKKNSELERLRDSLRDL